MKKSEMEHRLKAVILGAMGGPENPGTLAKVEAAAQALAPLACVVVWEPEEEPRPKMLPVWGNDKVRLLVDGTWEINDDGGWGPMNFIGSCTKVVYDELRNRLLNEREEFEKARNLGRPRHVYSGPSTEDDDANPDILDGLQSIYGYSEEAVRKQLREWVREELAIQGALVRADKDEMRTRIDDLARRLSLHETRLMAVENASSAQARTMERRLGESLEAEQKLAELADLTRRLEQAGEQRDQLLAVNVAQAKTIEQKLTDLKARISILEKRPAEQAR